MLNNLSEPGIDPPLSTSGSGPTSSSSSRSSSTPDYNSIRNTITTHIDTTNSALHTINRALHSNPETAYREHFAHDTLTTFLSERGFSVKQHAYGLDTSFEAEYGSGGRLVIVCAEYDALPEIGHACGHNLIATSSVATFLAVAEAMKKHGIQGRVRILGTPAEEGGGGKAKLITAGAFAGAPSAAIMAHPTSKYQLFWKPETTSLTGLAGFKLIASHKFRTEFRGKTAHAAGEPWNGVNALDAAVAAYSNVGLMRQQMQPDERVHSVIEQGGTVPNVIPEYTRMNWNVRAPTKKRADALLEKVKNCIGAGALASGCTVEYIESPTYLDLRANKTLCETYAADMESIGSPVQIDQEKPLHASTDMGNVSHIVPSFHGAFVIPTTSDVAAHNPKFAEAAGTQEGHEAALTCAKGMAMLAIRVLADENVSREAWSDFQTKD